MLIHLIEDDAFKCANIMNFIKSLDPKIHIDTAQSVDSGLRYIVKNKNKIDLLLLDMTMPSYDFDESTAYINDHQNFGGKDILSQMIERKINIPVVVITMFNTIDDISFNSLADDLNQNFSSIYKGIIFYSSKDSSWTKELTNYILEFNNG
ncbi:hypothetical protein ABLT91_08420 [Acinetobacter pittii]|uniref:hypothetical protein n=1 Tax=Acinetobacter pittii TaxID=48296 RepID=UPI0024DEF98B|nr:hypothetical protein [Acinetobacter pittii]